MKKAIAYPLSVLYYLCFGLLLVVFHPVQWVCFNFFGYNAHRKSVVALNWGILRCTNILGTRYTFDNPHTISNHQPIIIVANHQSMYDIPPIIFYMRRFHPKFISKIELGRGIPSVSYNLRHGGSVLIDRKNSEQALSAIKEFAERIEKNNHAAVIFPEGTRSKTGVPKKFQINGLKLLIDNIPSASIIPVTINNSWKLVEHGDFPMGIGTHIKFTVHPPLKVSEYNKEELIRTVENTIVADVVND